MKTGAVALIDALGFRGIWDRYAAADVMAHMTNMQEWFDDRVRKQFETQPSIKVSLAFLSDTIAIAYTCKRGMLEDQQLPGHWAESIGDVISWILDWSLQAEIPFAYRGAIAVGQYEMSPHFLIGPAVDDAATHYEMAEGAFIWMTPGARRHMVERIKVDPKNTHKVRFNVPLKGGSTIDTFTVSPIMHANGLEGANAHAATLLKTFSGQKLDVEMKRQNTLQHLRACYRWRGFEFPKDLEDGERVRSGPGTDD